MTVSRQAAVAARFESSMLLVLLLSLALGCGGDGGTGPTVGRIGPFPAGLTGKVALVTEGVITSGSVSYTQTKVHVIDLADPVDRVIYTAQDVDLQGLTWAPDGQHLLIQTLKFQIGPNGENQSTWELHLLNIVGTQDQFIFEGSGPESHPGYSANGRLAYFGGWSPTTGADSQGIYIDGNLTLLLSWDANSYLSWAPDGSALVYSGLNRLTLADSNVALLLPPDSGEVITQPAYSPDGARIAIMRFAGRRKGQEIWTVTATGADGQQLTAGFYDAFPTWTPRGQYIAFAREGSSAPGVYLIASGGGTPTRVVSVGRAVNLTQVAWSP